MSKDRRYFELDETVSLLLNKDWIYEPHIKYACAQVLTGSIVTNSDNGKPMPVNTIEAYGKENRLYTQGTIY